MQEKLIFKSNSQWVHFLIHFAISIVLGILWFLLLYGRYPLYVSHVNWIYNTGGDLLQQQIGWEFFRYEPSRFPLGSIKAFGYPIGTNTTYMNVLPLIGFPFKLLSPWLEENFQYWGLWELSSIIGQVFFGMLILNEFTRSYPLKMLGASMLVLSTPMIFRSFYHSPLSAHWILLAAIWLILLEYRRRINWDAWPLLFGVTVLVQLYIIPIIMPMWLISLYFRFRNGARWPRLLCNVLTSAAVFLLVGYIFGIFILNYKDLSLAGFGTFSWNLNSFINPFYFGSAFLKEMPVIGGQYEGFSYLGMGNFLILPAAVFLFPQRENLRRRLPFILPFLIVSVIYILYALSNRAYLGHTMLWDIRLPESIQKLFNLFRSSGRFIWPVFYFIVIFGLVSAIRYLHYPLLVLAFALILQYADLHPLYMVKRLDGFVPKYEAALDNEFWQAAGQTNEHLVVLSPRYTKGFANEPLALFAAKHRMTLNYGYFARSDGVKNAEYVNQVWNDLLAGKADVETVYFLPEPSQVDLLKVEQGDAMLFCEVDGYSAALSAQNKMMSTDFDFTPFCSGPEP